MRDSPFDAEPDPELGRLLRERLTGPDPEAFLRRLRQAAAAPGAPAGDQWDVLARWARPRVMAVAVAAGFLLWLGVWLGSVEQPAEQEPGVQVASLPAHAIVMPGVASQDEFVTAVMESR